MTGSGYWVTHDGLGDAAKDMAEAAQHLATIREGLPTPQCGTPAAFGGEEAAPAYDNFVESWHAEGEVLHAALREITTRLHTTGNNYATTEQTVSHRLTSAGTTPFG